jgi:hypothetical protein
VADEKHVYTEPLSSIGPIGADVIFGIENNFLTLELGGYSANTLT